MHSDFAWCRADLAMLRAEGDQRIAGAASESARRRARHDRDRACDQLLACAIIWMWRCYEGVWAELRRYFDLPDILIVRAIEKAIQGTWRDAVVELCRIPRVVLAGDAAHLQYQAIIAQIVTSDLPQAECTQLIATICAAQIERAKLPRLTPDGRPSKHALRMELYLKWRAQPPGRGRTEAFITAVADKHIAIEGLAGRELTAEGVKSQLTAARKWLGPKRDKVPVAPHAYLPPPGSCTP
jgi:hypothetical protein